MSNTTIVASPVSNFRRTADWLKACGKTPNTKDASTQIGVHLEELTEQLDCINIVSTTGVTHAALQEVSQALKAIATNLKLGHAQAVVYDHEQLLDALSDGEVTGNGVAYTLGYDKEGHDSQVLDKNDDKFEEDGKPVILEGGKIGKRANWTPPDATPYITNAIVFPAA